MCKFGARVGKYKLGARVVKYNLGARAGKYKLGARADEHKVGARARARAGGQVKDHRPGKTNTQFDTIKIMNCKNRVFSIPGKV